MRHAARLALGIVVALPAGVFAAGYCPDCAFRDRDPKTSEHRMEGLLRVPTFGALAVLSFMGLPAGPLSLDGAERLHLRFYVPQAGSVFITTTARQGRGASPYCMKPNRSDWPAGWQDFSWPANAVLRPADISADTLVTIAWLGADAQGSGPVTPALMHGGNVPVFHGDYALWLLSTCTLEELRYVAVRVSDGKKIKSGALQNLPANVPFELTFSLRDEQEGEYEFSVKGREIDHTLEGGPGLRLTFQHRRELGRR